MEIEVGSPVPLNLQLYDGAEKEKVIANLFTTLGELLGSFELSHQAGGLYISNEFLMPDIRLVIAQYIVDSDKYEIVTDTFYKKYIEEEVEEEVFEEAMPLVLEESYVYGMVTEEQKRSDFIYGVAI